MDPQLVSWECPDCDESLTGIEGQIARCPYCYELQDAPYIEEGI